MKKIYSKIDRSNLLHMVFRKNEISRNRTDISPSEELLQVSAFIIDKGKTFRPHKHIEKHVLHTITQESWIVFSGKVKVFHYDLDDKLINEDILESGDITITFHGGHTYESLEDNTYVFEVKTGPYYGQSKDKVFINQ